MTRKRLIVIAGILVSVACIVLVTLAMLPPRPGITKANYDRISIGMFYWNDIEPVLGKPGDSTTGRYSFSDPTGIEPAPDAKGNARLSPFYDVPGRRVWIGDEGIISIHFDNKDNVTSKIFYHVEPVNPSFYRLVRMKLGL